MERKAGTWSQCFDRKGEEVSQIVLLLICPVSTNSKESVMVRTEAQRFVNQNIYVRNSEDSKEKKGLKAFYNQLNIIHWALTEAHL